MISGAIVVDKPAGWTSHDVVGKVRRLANTKKVGHLGTLDPIGTGVLPLVVERATRLAQFYVRSDKVYDAVFRFGYSTTTYDAQGETASAEVSVDLRREDLERELRRFVGVITQAPPPVSAKKVGGIPAYKLVRKQVAFELAPVEVTVFSIDLLEVETTRAHVRVHCSGGTYIRSIAHDLGAALGCGAFLEALRREVSGDFTLSQARTIDELQQMSADGRIEEAVIPAAQLLPDFPAENVDSITAGMIRQGRDFRVSPFRSRSGAKYVRAIDPSGQLLAIGEARMANIYHPILVL